MSSSVLARYLDPEVLSRVAGRGIEPRGLVMGNLAGAHRSPASGFAVEFAGHREYVPGDDPKHIDWRVYFTRDKYFIKQYEMETNFTCHLLLDISSSMRYGEGDEQKLLYASRMATVLGHSIVRQSDKVSLATFDTHIRGHIRPSNSMHQVVKMTQHLDEVEAIEKTNLAQCLSELAERMQRREIVMIFSDFFGELESLEAAIQRLRFSKHEVVLFQVMHHDELYFDMDGMIRFVGLEAAEQFLAQPEDLRAAYLEAVGAFNKQLEEISLRNGCDHVLVDTREDMASMFADYLNKRMRMPRR
ncbi:DUF58 domain-containing protein [Blastopirellula sp. JC732]|uniref:DUF58 domain-containing protein n=1 Tax=Blastopirellula sediminis TaxID=2894196 RepID=A0A9X1MLH9_9BACT|nr:DUF58 domain-containing protein [Blastopirellula sediminis]MCC9609515.1 DUF58 domain-containing protein [Blastopirellula sediminis]MCC9627709.1 DUF58 domain-containing protein [Blastopirellula sediminis]